MATTTATNPKAATAPRPRRLNVKLLLGLFVGTAVLAAGIHFLHASQLRRSATSLLAEAERAETAGETAKAQENLERYLFYQPNDTQAMVRLGKLLGDSPELANRLRAIQVYEKVLQREPSLDDVRRRYAELAVAAGRYREAKSHLDVLLRAHPDDGPLRLLLGQCLEGLKNNSEAITQYIEATSSDPTLVDAYVRLANLRRTQGGDPKVADKVIAEMIENNGGSAQAYLERARYRTRFNQDKDKATEDIAKALELAPDDVEVLLAAADQARTRSDFKAAREHLKHGLEGHPEHRDLIRALAYVENQAGNREQAIEKLQEALELYPEDVDLRWTLADALINSGKAQEASDQIAELKKLGVLPELVRYLEGRVLIVRGQWSEAAKALEQAKGPLTTRPETSGMGKLALMMLAQCHERLGNLDQAYEAFEAANRVRIGLGAIDDQAELGSAAALAALGRVAQAIEAYKAVLPKKPREAGIPLTRLLIKQNLGHEAADWRAVDSLLDRLERALPDAPEVKVLRAEALAAQGQAQAAREALTQEIDQQPLENQIDLWITLAMLTAREALQDPTKLDAALSVLDDAQKRLGDKAALRSARALILSQRGPAAAEALTQLEQGTDAFTPEEQVSLQRNLAMAYGRIGKIDDAERLWTAVAQRMPADRNVNLILFDLALQNGREADAEKLLARIEARQGQGASDWRFGRAAMLIRQAQKASPADRAGKLSEARGLLDKVLVQRPSWGRGALAMAQVEELEGNLENAIRHYLLAIELGDRNPVAIAHVAQLLNAQKRYGEASQVLQSLKDSRTALSPELQRLEAQVAFQNQDYAQAASQAEKLVPEDSQNYRDQIWLGQIQWAAGKPAEAAFRRAVAVAQDAPEAWTALIAYLAGTNQAEAAEKALRDAQNALPGDRAAIVLAQGYEKLGKVDLAKEWFQKALAAAPHDAFTLQAAAGFNVRAKDYPQAKDLLERIVALPNEPAANTWAKNLLAQIFVVEGGARGAHNAINLLDENSPAPNVRTGSPQDLRTRAKILALLPNSERRREAINVLEALIERQVATPEDRYLLAQLFEAEGDWPKARDQMTRVLESPAGKNPAYLAAYIRSLLRQKQATFAQAQLAKLEQIAPGQPATIEVKARVLHALGKDAEAVKMLKDFAGEDTARIGVVARLLEDLTLYDEAKALYEGLANRFKDNPQAVVPLAAFLGRREQTKAALKLIDDAVWNAMKPELASTLCTQILYGAPQGDPDLPGLAETIAERLQKAIAANPDSVSLQFDLGNLRCLQGNFKEAEGVFRDVHRRNVAIGAPLNNLAWMLALLDDGRTDEALSLIDQAIDLDGATPDLLDTRALINIVRKQADPAIKDLEDAIRVAPTKDKYFHLARAYYLANRVADSRNAFRKAVQDLGLTKTDLHPLERKAYDELNSALTQK